MSAWRSIRDAAIGAVGEAFVDRVSNYLPAPHPDWRGKYTESLYPRRSKGSWTSSKYSTPERDSQAHKSIRQTLESRKRSRSHLKSFPFKVTSATRTIPVDMPRRGYSSRMRAPFRKKRRFIRSRSRRPRRRFTRRPRRVAGRFGRYRRRSRFIGRRSSRYSRRRKYVRGGLRRRRRATLSRSFKSAVRKTVGDCYNELIIRSEGVAMNQPNPYYTVQTNYAPHVFRILSDWFNTKGDWIAMQRHFLTAAQITADEHLFPMSIKITFTVRNPCNYPIKVKLDRMHSRCNLSDPVYVEPAVGSYLQVQDPHRPATYSGGNAWLQDNRSPQVGQTVLGVSNPIMQTNLAAVLAPMCDQKDQFAAPAQKETINPWECLAIASGTQRLMMHKAFYMPLEYIFPHLKSTFKRKRMLYTTLKPFETRQVVVNVRCPSDVRPFEMQKTLHPMLTKDSFFLFLRAIAPSLGLGNTPQSATVGFPDATNRTVQYAPGTFHPAVVEIGSNVKIAMRSSADRFPSYNLLYDFASDPATLLGSTREWQPLSYGCGAGGASRYQNAVLRQDVNAMGTSNPGQQTGRYGQTVPTIMGLAFNPGIVPA